MDSFDLSFDKECIDKWLDNAMRALDRADRYAEGYAQGYEEGYAEGREEVRMEIFDRLIEMELLTDSQIAHVLDISLEEVVKLRVQREKRCGDDSLQK